MRWWGRRCQIRQICDRGTSQGVPHSGNPAAVLTCILYLNTRTAEKCDKPVCSQERKCRRKSLCESETCSSSSDYGAITLAPMLPGAFVAAGQSKLWLEATGQGRRRGAALKCPWAFQSGRAGEGCIRRDHACGTSYSGSNCETESGVSGWRFCMRGSFGP